MLPLPVARVLTVRYHSLPMAVLLKNKSFQDSPSFKVNLEIRVPPTAYLKTDEFLDQDEFK